MSKDKVPACGRKRRQKNVKPNPKSNFKNIPAL
jgi:hypothetical protein